MWQKVSRTPKRTVSVWKTSAIAKQPKQPRVYLLASRTENSLKLLVAQTNRSLKLLAHLSAERWVFRTHLKHGPKLPFLDLEVDVGDADAS